jgi:transposase
MSLEQLTAVKVSAYLSQDFFLRIANQYQKQNPFDLHLPASQKVAPLENV